jgi:riboflavin synthase
MFTGIVEELGEVVSLDRGSGVARLRVACATVTDGARIGDSISVNGCCLTATALHDGAEGPQGFSTEMMGETLARTSLGELLPGHPVNLEAALRADGRLGGHLVQGHVDGVARVVAVEPQDPQPGGEGWTVMRFSLPEPLSPYLVEKGSVTVDGTSLTVMSVEDGSFAVGLIPHTLAVTVLGSRRVGDAVNLEVDIIAKYVERMLRAGVSSPYKDAS